MSARVRVVIPARLAAMRLPNKPLLLVDGVPLIVHAVRQARRLPYGEVMVATPDEEIAEVVEREGCEAVMTRRDLASGSDRIFAALESRGSRGVLDAVADEDIVVNLQGDMPWFDTKIVTKSVEVLEAVADADVATAVVAMPRGGEDDTSKVKAVGNFGLGVAGRVFYFSRSAVPHNGPYYLHIGIYAYRARALRAFVKARVTPLEQQEKLEQIRGLSCGLSYYGCLLDCEVPWSIDTREDYENFQKAYKVLKKS